MLDGARHVPEAEAASSESAWDAKASGADPSSCTFAFAKDADGQLVQPVSMHKAQGIGLRSGRVLELLRLPELALAASALVRRGLEPLPSDAPRERLEVDAFGTKFFPVVAGSVGSVAWHDDNYYFGTERSHTISCAVYLREIDAQSGCLRVVAGSHKDAEVGAGRAHLYTPSAQLRHPVAAAHLSWCAEPQPGFCRTARGLLGASLHLVPPGLTHHAARWVHLGRAHQATRRVHPRRDHLEWRARAQRSWRRARAGGRASAAWAAKVRQCSVGAVEASRPPPAFSHS